CDGNDAPPLGERIPLPHHLVRTIEQASERLRRPERVGGQRPQQVGWRLVPPLAVAVQPLEAVERRVPGGPLEFALRRAGMSDDRKSSEPMDVVHHITAFAAERKRDLVQTKRDDMSAIGADFHRVEYKDVAAISGWFRSP